MLSRRKSLTLNLEIYRRNSATVFCLEKTLELLYSVLTILKDYSRAMDVLDR